MLVGTLNPQYNDATNTSLVKVLLSQIVQMPICLQLLLTSFTMEFLINEPARLLNHRGKSTLLDSYSKRLEY